MTQLGQPEIVTQGRVIAFFRDSLGYVYLGNWKDRPDNSNLEEGLLSAWLTRQGYSDKIIAKGDVRVAKERWRSAVAGPSMMPIGRSTICSAMA